MNEGTATQLAEVVDTELPGFDDFSVVEIEEVPAALVQFSPVLSR